MSTKCVPKTVWLDKILLKLLDVKKLFLANRVLTF